MMKKKRRAVLTISVICTILVAVSAACSPSPEVKPTLHEMTQEAVLTEKIISPTAGIPSLTSTPTTTPALISDDPLLPVWAGPAPAGARMRLGKGWVVDIDVFSEGNLMVVGGTAGLFLYRADSFELVWARPMEAKVLMVAFSKDGRRIATEDSFSEIVVWDTSTGDRLQTFQPENRGSCEGFFYGIALSADGGMLAAGCGSAVRVWDLRREAAVRSDLVEGEDRVYSLDFSPDGRTLAVGYLHPYTGVAVPVECEGCETPTEGTPGVPVVLWDLASGKKIRFLAGHQDGVSAIAFSPDGKRIATGGLDNRVYQWEMASGRREFSLEGIEDESIPYAAITSLDYSTDGKKLAAGLEYNPPENRFPGQAIIWDALSGARLGTLDGTKEEMTAVAFLDDGNELITGPRGYPNRGLTVFRWNISNGERLIALDGFTNSVEEAAIRPDGTTLASASSDGTVVLWNEPSGERLRVTDIGDEYYKFAFSPDGATLAILPSTWDRAILWDVVDGAPLSTLQPSGITADCYDSSDAAFAPDGKNLGFAICQSITIWDAAGGREIGRLQKSPELIYGMAFSPDGKMIAACADVNLEEKNKYGYYYLPGLNVWNRFSGARIYRWTGPDEAGSPEGWGGNHALSFSIDGKTVASASWGHLILWEIPSGNPRIIAVGGYSIQRIAFSPDGKLLAAGTDQGDILILDSASGEILRTLRGHTDRVKVVTFSADGKTLASGSEDGTIILWNVE